MRNITRLGSEDHGTGTVTATPKGTYQLLADLPLEVDSYALERLALDVSSGFRRVTTVVRIRGGGVAGLGEDVTYVYA